MRLPPSPVDETGPDWVTFAALGGGLVAVQARHVVAIYDEGGAVKLSTVAGGVHTLAPGLGVGQAAALVSEVVAEAAAWRGASPR